MIAIQRLRKRFGRQLALDDVSFEVPKGEIFGFVGPNGAGKTTTIRILATLAPADSGIATIGGIPVGDDPGAVRELVGYMPDFFGVYDRLTAVEYLEFYAACHGVARSRRRRVAMELLELVDLGDRRDTQVDTLSRGLKQRLCLARALVHDPSVLLLDEPASGLDPRARVEMRELGPMAQVRDRVVAGRRLRIELVVAEESAMRAAEEVLAGHPGVLAVDLLGDHIEITVGDGFEDADLLAHLVHSKVPVRAFAVVAGDLSEAFMRLTGPGEEGSR